MRSAQRLTVSRPGLASARQRTPPLSRAASGGSPPPLRVGCAVLPRMASPARGGSADDSAGPYPAYAVEPLLRELRGMDEDPRLATAGVGAAVAASFPSMPDEEFLSPLVPPTGGSAGQPRPVSAGAPGAVHGNSSTLAGPIVVSRTPRPIAQGGGHWTSPRLGRPSVPGALRPAATGPLASRRFPSRARGGMPPRLSSPRATSPPPVFCWHLTLHSPLPFFASDLSGKMLFYCLL